jgi:protein arginine N-methyltransferase 1
VPLFERHIPAIVDARRRFLAPGGTLIPRKDTLWAAIVEAPKPYGEFVDPWDCNPLGQDLTAARQLVVNNTQKVRVNANQLLTAHRLWTTLDYSSVENPDARGKLDWRVERTGPARTSAWFDTSAEGLARTLLAPEALYGFFLDSQLWHPPSGECKRRGELRKRLRRRWTTC